MLFRWGRGVRSLADEAELDLYRFYNSIIFPYNYFERQIFGIMFLSFNLFWATRKSLVIYFGRLLGLLETRPFGLHGNNIQYFYLFYPRLVLNCFHCVGGLNRDDKGAACRYRQKVGEHKETTCDTGELCGVS